jgi:hypothetical protein
MNTLLLSLADAQGFFFGLGTTALVLALVASIFWVWAIIDCAVNPRIDGIQKVVWLLVIFFLPLLGAIVYFAVGRNPSGQPLSS